MASEISWGDVLKIMLSEVPWGQLIRAFLDLISKQAPRIEAKEITPENAMWENVNTVYEETKRSPGVDRTILVILHQLAYGIYTKTRFPEKFARMEDSIRKWVEETGDKYNYFSEESRVAYETTDFMSLYKARPDKK